MFYDSFAPFFADKGCRGIIGTIYKIPAIFASKFAMKFFEGLFQGERIGKLLPCLRNEFVNTHNNLLGLLYTSYCRSNIRIRRSSE